MKKSFILFLLLLFPFTMMATTFYLGIDITGVLIPYVGVGVDVGGNEGILKLGIAVDNTALVIVPSARIATDIDWFHLGGGVKFILPLGYGKSLTLIDIQTAYNFDTFAGRGRIGLGVAIPVFSETNRFAVVPSLFAELGTR